MSKIQVFPFEQLNTLSSTIWTCDSVKKSWKWSNRSVEAVMQRFVELNQRNLSYIDITACVESINGKPAIKLTTSKFKFVGAIPFISPMNGKAAGGFNRYWSIWR